MGILRKALFAGSLLGLLSGSVKAADTGGLYMPLTTPTTGSDFYYQQIPGASQGYDPLYDASWINNPLGANIYSTSPGGEPLTVNSVPANSTMPVEMTIINSSGLNGNLGFMFYDTGYGDTMANEQYMLDLYHSSGDLFGSYDVNNYAETSQTVAIPNGSSLHGTLYQVPEPGTVAGGIGLLVAAGGLLWLKRRKNAKKAETNSSRNKPGDGLDDYFNEEYRA